MLEIAAGGWVEIRLPVTFFRPGEWLAHARLTTARLAAGGTGEVRGSAVSKPGHVSVK